MTNFQGSGKTVRMGFDDRAITMDGRRELLISGEVHYARVPEDEWEKVLDASKAAGLNCIATYVFWNWHEPEEGKYDFSGPRDLPRWLRLCQERGLHVILRSGPYCCAEWNFGGFPAWLRDVPGVVFRTYNPPYLQRVERYFRHLFVEVKPHLASNGGPIAVVQLENEYANIAARYGAEGDRYLAWMVDLGNSLGIDVPVLMCEGGAEGAIEALNGFHVTDERIEEFKQRRPHDPIICTELWTGWYNTWGYGEPIRDTQNQAYHILRFLAGGGTAWNYYMWHGGSNFGRTAMYLQTTDYGFDAPLDQWGRLSPKGEYLAGLHHAVAAQKEFLLQGRHERKADAAIWEKDGRSLRIEWDAKARHARLLGAKGEVLFDTATPVPKKAKQVGPWREVTRLKKFAWTPEPLPAERNDAPMTAREPVEQLLLTKDRSDYCWYSTQVMAIKAGAHELHLPYCGDFLRVYVNGQPVAKTPGRLPEIRGSTLPVKLEQKSANSLEVSESKFHLTFQLPLKKGKNRIDILCGAVGLIKGDWMISGPMTGERKGIWAGAFLDGKRLTNWEMRPGLAGETSDVTRLKIARRNQQFLGWWTTTWKADPKTLNLRHDFRLDLTAFDKGMIYVNGRLLGRYWSIIGEGKGPDDFRDKGDELGLDTQRNGEPSQVYYRVPPSWLKETNEIVLLEEATPTRKPEIQVDVRKA